jgi:hypothetical protein
MTDEKVLKLEGCVEDIRSDVILLKITQAVHIEKLDNLSKRFDLTASKIEDIHRYLIELKQKVPTKKSAGWVSQIVMLAVAALVGGFTSATFTHLTTPSQNVTTTSTTQTSSTPTGNP